MLFSPEVFPRSMPGVVPINQRHAMTQFSTNFMLAANVTGLNFNIVHTSCRVHDSLFHRGGKIFRVVLSAQSLEILVSGWLSCCFSLASKLVWKFTIHGEMQSIFLYEFVAFCAVFVVIAICDQGVPASCSKGWSET